MYFCKIRDFAYWEINERSFSNPSPGLNSRLVGPHFLTVPWFIHKIDDKDDANKSHLIQII